MELLSVNSLTSEIVAIRTLRGLLSWKKNMGLDFSQEQEQFTSRARRLAQLVKRLNPASSSKTSGITIDFINELLGKDNFLKDPLCQKYCRDILAGIEHHNAKKSLKAPAKELNHEINLAFKNLNNICPEISLNEVLDYLFADFGHAEGCLGRKARGSSVHAEAHRSEATLSS